MAVNTSGLDKKLRNMNKILRKAASKSVLSDIGEEARDLIYKRVKSGSGVTSDKAKSPRKSRLKALGATASSPTDARRKYIARRRRIKLGKFGTPSKSNLTLTGQMLEALRYIVRGNKVRVDVPPSPRSKIGNESNPPTNKEVAENVSKKRPWLALTDTEQSILRRKLRDLVNSLIRRL